ncbi:hypothetical protein O6H91_04G062600 [Diphasiastrum complanatum]|uniref:Uncharacterized protein n=1 Tax=Diphasiastrum complanatum TaxID=34168 RepID=A0ACC2DXZ0_DIPCM|nr:hypothetical protein O6H91_04G062600 [Diphasiastrum complanatum]
MNRLAKKTLAIKNMELRRESSTQIPENACFDMRGEIVEIIFDIKNLSKIRKKLKRRHLNLVGKKGSERWTGREMVEALRRLKTFLNLEAKTTEFLKRKGEARRIFEAPDLELKCNRKQLVERDSNLMKHSEWGTII